MVKPKLVKSWRDFPRGAWSHSALNQLANLCGQQYKFRKILRTPAESRGPNLSFGITLDEAVFKPFYMAMKAGERPTEASLLKAFKARWTEELANPLLRFPDEKKPPAWWQEKGAAVISIVMSDAPDMKVRDTDVRFVVPLVFPDGTPASERPLTGAIDMLTIGGEDRLLVVDYKTADKSPAAMALSEDLQSVSYTYALGQVFPEMVGKIDFMWQYYVLTKKPTYKPYDRTVTEADIVAFMRLVQMADRVVQADAFMPRRNHNFACKNCEFRMACNKLIGKPEDA